MSATEKLLQEARILLEALEQGDNGRVEDALHRFQEAIEAAWNLYQQGRINTAVRGLPKVMYMWAMEELPQMVQEPSKWPEVRRQLAQFINAVQLVVEPKEEA